MPRLLVVEDQRKLLRSLKKGLEQEGYAVVTAETGEEGYYAATTGEFDAAPATVWKTEWQGWTAALTTTW